MLNRKRLGLIIIIVGLILLAFLIYFFFFRNKKTETPTGPVLDGENQAIEISTNTPGTAPRNYQKYTATKDTSHTVNADDLGKRGMAFAERLGSFSSQSNYGNFEDLKIVMTKKMQTWADSYVATLEKDKQGADYYGITTKSLSYQVASFDEKAGKAQLTISTMRRESLEAIGGGQNFPQTLSLAYVKVNGDWLVDAAYWEKK